MIIADELNRHKKALRTYIRKAFCDESFQIRLQLTVAQ
jgi:hypothetical protein